MDVLNTNEERQAAISKALKNMEATGEMRKLIGARPPLAETMQALEGKNVILSAVEQVENEYNGEKVLTTIFRYAEKEGDNSVILSFAPAAQVKSLYHDGANHALQAELNGNKDNVDKIVKKLTDFRIDETVDTGNAIAMYSKAAEEIEFAEVVKDSEATQTAIPRSKWTELYGKYNSSESMRKPALNAPVFAKIWKFNIATP